MSIKLKLVSCISAFILVLGIFIFGVLSAEQATVNLGGSISFEATDVYARVTGRVQYAQTNPTLQPLEFSADNDNPDQSSWSGLQLQFDSQATNITIEVTVENLSMERTLTVNLTDMMQTSTDNLRKTITLDGGSYVSGTNTAPIPVATSNDSATNTSKVTFLITFDVIDHNRSLPSTDFDYDINLMDENYEPVYEILEGFSFNENGVLLGYTGNEPNVVIPSSYSIIGVEDKSLEFSSYNEFVDYMDSNDATLLTSMLNITVIVDGTSCGTYPDFTTASSDNAFMVAMQNATQSIIFEYQENISVVGQEYTVTGISMGAFMNNNNLESIIIPEGITSIGSNAFYKCTNLTEINYNAKSANDLSSRNMVFAYAGQNGDGITVNIGVNVKHIPAVLFAGGSPYTPNILEVHFAEGSQLESIGLGAFDSCSGLTSITIPESVTSIGAYAFYNCDGLTSIAIPEGVTSIAGSVFSACDSLESITIPDSVTSIGGSTFSYCSSLTSITISDSVTSIGREAFFDCSSLTSITIPDSVTSIGYRAFYGCSSLTSITIPESVISIGDSAFSSCDSLTAIEVDSVNTAYSSDEYGVLYNKDKTTLIQYPICNTRTSYTIPEGVESIRMEAFSGCSNLTSITIPEGVTSIGNWAFSGCSGLTSITIPDSVTSIGSSAFDGCFFSEVTIDSSYAYKNAGADYDECGYLLQGANIVYVNANLVEDTSLTASSYLTSNFTRSETAENGYYVYTRN